MVEKIKLNYKYERCDDAKIAGYHSISCKIALVKTGIQLRPSTTDRSSHKPDIRLFFSFWNLLFRSKSQQQNENQTLKNKRISGLWLLGSVVEGRNWMHAKISSVTSSKNGNFPFKYSLSKSDLPDKCLLFFEKFVKKIAKNVRFIRILPNKICWKLIS